MARTVVDLRDDLIARARRLTGLRRKVEIVNAALETFVDQHEAYRDLLALRGKVSFRGSSAPSSASAMVLVDSSPWIDMLSGSPTPEAGLLTAWLRDGRPGATTGPVLQEVLQGARAARDFNLLRGRLGRLPFLRIDKETYVEAARFYRKARARAWTVPATDALIAAVAVVHGVALLTADRRYFRALARVSKLRLAS